MYIYICIYIYVYIYICIYIYVYIYIILYIYIAVAGYCCKKNFPTLAMRVWCGRAGLECWRCQDERGHWYVGPKLSDTFHRTHPWMPRNRGSGPTGKAYWSSIRLRKVASSGCCILLPHAICGIETGFSTNAKYPFWTAKLWEGNITKIWADRMANFSHSSTVAWAPDMLLLLESSK